AADRQQHPSGRRVLLPRPLDSPYAGALVEGQRAGQGAWLAALWVSDGRTGCCTSVLYSADGSLRPRRFMLLCGRPDSRASIHSNDTGAMWPPWETSHQIITSAYSTSRVITILRSTRPVADPRIGLSSRRSGVRGREVHQR